MAPLLPSSLQQEEEIEEDESDIVVIFFAEKNKKGVGEGSLPSSSHFYHHLEATLAFALLLPPC
jgi:hypothetical protein